MKTIFWICGLVLVSSCVNQQKIAKRYYQDNKGELAVLCDDEFPNEPIKIIQGETIIKTDTVKIPGQVIPCPEPTPDNPHPTITCPPNTIIKTVEHRVDTLQVVDQQRIKALEFQYQKCLINEGIVKAENERLKKENKLYFWILVALGGVGLFFVFRKV